MNTAQKMQLERVKYTNFNNFDGEKIAAGLVQHQNLWTGFVFGSFRYNLLLELRDIHTDCINADTVMVLTNLENAQRLCEIAKKEWAANEVGYSGVVNGEFITYDYDPCHTKDELWQDLGGIDDGTFIVRLWWD